MKYMRSIFCIMVAMAACCACAPSDPLVVRTKAGVKCRRT